MPNHSTPDDSADALHIRPATAADAPAITDIYRPFVTDNAVSFEFEAPSVATMAERIRATNAQWIWLVAERSGRCVGYAYGNQFRTREAYRWTVETSAYLAADCYGLGIATQLYKTLFTSLIDLGYRRAIAAITLPNEASVRFHKRLGFESVGILKQVGYKFDQWHDVAYYQRPLSDAPPSPLTRRA